MKILFFLFLVSCASSPKLEKKDIIVDEVTNKDFVRKKAIPYVKSKDKYQNIKDDYSKLMNDETLELVESEKKPEDILEDVSRNCYSQKFEEAFILVDKIYDEYRTNPTYWNIVGNCFTLKKEYRKALLYYNKATDINSSYVPSLNNQGVVYAKLGEDQKAIVSFERATASGAFSKVPKFNIGLLYLKYGLYEKAQKIFNTLIGLNQEDVEVLNALAVSHLFQGNAKEALNYYNKIPKRFLSYSHIGINYALAKFKFGDSNLSKDILSSIDKKNLGQYQSYYEDVSRFIGVK